MITLVTVVVSGIVRVKGSPMVVMVVGAVTVAAGFLILSGPVPGDREKGFESNRATMKSETVETDTISLARFPTKAGPSLLLYYTRVGSYYIRIYVRTARARGASFQGNGLSSDSLTFFDSPMLFPTWRIT